MAINLTSPTGFTAGVLIADTTDDANGSLGGVQTITQVNGVPIAAALEIKSTKGALVLPRMTSAQRDALANAGSAVVNGMMIYNTDNNGVQTYANGGWGDAGFLSTTTVLNQAQILALNSAGAAPVLVPAPGAGFFIAIDSVTMINRYNTAPFADGGNVSIGYGPTPANVIANSAISGNTFAAAFVLLGATTARVLATNSATNFATATIANKPIGIAAAADFTGGNAASTIAITVRYSIFSVA